MKPLDYIVDGILAILVMFIATLLYFGLKQDSMTMTLTHTDTASLVEDVRSRGYLTKEMYEDFLENLSKTGLRYDVTLEHRKLLYEPIYRLRTPEEVIDEQNTAFTGDNTYHYRDVKTDIPQVLDPVSTGPLNTETNESILAKAVNKAADPNHVHSDACYTGHVHTAACYSPAFYAVQGSSNQLAFYCKNCDMLLFTIGYDSDGEYIVDDYYDFRGDHWNINNIKYGSADDSLFDSIYTYFYSHSSLVNGVRCCDVPSGVITQEPVYGTIRCHYCNDYRILIHDGGFSIMCLHCHKYICGGSYDFLAVYNPDGTQKTYSKPFSTDVNNFINTVMNANTAGHTPESYTLRMMGQTFLLHGVNLYDPGCSASMIHIPSTWSGFNYDCIRGLVNHGCKNGDFSFCGQEGTLDCGNIVTSITPTNPTQTVYVGDNIISTVIASYLNGATKTIVATISGFDKNKVGTQTVTLTYSGIVDTGTTTGTKACTISVAVIPKTKTCPNGHTYNLNSDGTDPGCPYCKAWLKSLVVQEPSTGRITIYRGTTLKQNDVTLLATYMDGHNELVTDTYVDNLDKGYVGSQNVTLSYKGQYTYLNVNVKRNIVKCPVCGRYYELNPDDTDPGCPYCAARTPIFTGNIRKYYDKKYTDEILQELFKKSGTYYFSRDDYFLIKLTNSSRSLGGKLTAAFYQSLADGTIRTEAGGYIRQNGQ